VLVVPVEGDDGVSVAAVRFVLLGAAVVPVSSSDVRIEPTEEVVALVLILVVGSVDRTEDSMLEELV